MELGFFIDVAHDVALGLLMLFMAYFVFDWGRMRWQVHRHGFAVIDGMKYYANYPLTWETRYPSFKFWAWVARVATWLLALWHLTIALCWFADLWFAVSVS